MASKGGEEKDGTSILEKNPPPSRWRAKIKEEIPLYEWLIQKLGEREREREYSELLSESSTLYLPKYISSLVIPRKK